jgi:hypothetical protein
MAVGDQSKRVSVAQFGALVPAHMMEVYLETAQSGVTWHLIYNAASASAFKWEFVGGPPYRSYIEAEEVIAGVNGWANCTTVGPDFVAPRPGDYRVVGTATMYSSSATDQAFIGIANASLSPNPSAPQAVSNSELARRQTMICAPVMTGITIGQTLRMQYYAESVQHWFRQRLLEVTPLRIS